MSSAFRRVNLKNSSPEDETFTRELRRYMQGLGIRPCDHIIIDRGG
ncbi:MAG: JAB domain-containing protein [Verrucomicrobiota bacterium]